MRGRLLLLLASVPALLAGCPAPAPEGPPLSPGRVWRFTVAAGPDVEQAREVVSVGPTEVVVRVQTLIGGAPVGDPVVIAWPLRPPPAAPTGAPGEPFVIPGAPPIATWVTPGPTTVTTAVDDGRPAFPGVVRAEVEGAPRFRLRRVD